MKIIYTKFSNDRRAEFSIRTNILQGEDGKRYIEKLPMYDEGKSHVDALSQWEKALTEKYADTVYEPNRMVSVEGHTCFEFVEGETLEHRLDELLRADKVEEVCQELLAFADVVRKVNSSVAFEVTEDFGKVFGDVVPTAGMCYGGATDIDMIPANVILQNEQRVILDYEWTFDFPIPVHYVIYRILHYYVEGSTMRHVLHACNLYERAGLSEEELKVYATMEKAFQAYILKDMTPLWKMHAELAQRKFRVDEMVEKETGDSFHIDLFWDFGNGYEAANQQILHPELKETGAVYLRIKVPEKAKGLRLDPGDLPCILIWDYARGSFKPEGSEYYHNYQVQINTNAGLNAKGVYIFGTPDPQMYLQELIEDTQELVIRFSIFWDINRANRYRQDRQVFAPGSGAQDYDELERHYLTAIELRDYPEELLQEANRRAAEAEWKLHCIYRSIPYKLTKPFRMCKDLAKHILVGTMKKRLRWDTMKQRLKGQDARAYYASEYKRRSTLHFQDKMDKLVTAETLSAQAKEFKENTLCFSILVPVYNTPEKYLRQMIESVLAQSYPNYQLCIADGSDKAHKYVGKICKDYADWDSRICYQKLTKNDGIVGNTNEALAMATGEYIVLFDHDDFLHPEALYHVAKAVKETGAEYIYTDEAVFEKETLRKMTYHLKPDFSPDYLRGVNYICHLSAFSAELLQKVGGFRKECEGSQDYDMTLRLTEQANKVYHIPKVLYFWRSHPGSVASGIEAKTYCMDSAKRALSDHLNRVGLEGVVDDAGSASSYRIKYAIKDNPLVSILIPNKDHIDELKTCVDSIFDKSTYENFEIVIIENNSTKESTFEYYGQLQETYGDKIRVVTWEKGFNYAAINNFGAKAAKGEYLLLLNNDTEVITPDWIQEMLMFAQRDDVGAVGPMMYYDDDTIQHAGVIMGIGGTAGHSHKGMQRGSAGYLYKLVIAQNVSGVTGACLMIAKAKYEKLNGLDEKFVVAFNDVDFCCRLLDAGYLNVFTPFAELYHYESKSRGYEDTPEKMERFAGEKALLLQAHGNRMEQGDPYYNPSLTLNREDYSPADDFKVLL